MRSLEFAHGPWGCSPCLLLGQSPECGLKSLGRPLRRGAYATCAVEHLLVCLRVPWGLTTTPTSIPPPKKKKKKKIRRKPPRDPPEIHPKSTSLELRRDRKPPPNSRLPPQLRACNRSRGFFSVGCGQAVSSSNAASQTKGF